MEIRRYFQADYVSSGKGVCPAETGGFMIQVSMEEYADIVVNANNRLNKKQVMEWLKEARERKQNGELCIRCGKPIWAAGSAITGRYMCFSCITGERNDTDDYEIE